MKYDKKYDKISEKLLDIWRECYELSEINLLSLRRVAVLEQVKNLLGLATDMILSNEIKAKKIDKKLEREIGATEYVFNNLRESLL